MCRKHFPVTNCLRTLILMMGKLQVLSAHVEVETLTQKVEAHDDTFGMPTRPTSAEWCLPSGLSGLRRLPQSEVERASLFRMRFNPGSSTKLIEGLASKDPVISDHCYIEIDAI